MVEYGKIIADSLKMALEPKRWLPYFVFDAAAIGIVLYLVLSNIPLLKSLMNGMTGTALMASSLISALSIVLIIIVWVLGRIYLNGAMIHQGVKPREYDKSWKISRERYFSLLGVAVIVTIVAWTAGIVPYVGWLLSIIVALMFFFALPPVIASKKNFDDSLRESFKIFREKTLETIIVWVLIAVISSIIILLFALPLVFSLLNVLLPYVGIGGDMPVSADVLTALMANAWVLVPSLILLILGNSLMSVFEIISKTKFYMKLKK